MNLVSKSSMDLSPTDEQYEDNVKSLVTHIRDTVSNLDTNDAVVVTMTKHRDDANMLEIDRWVASNDADVLRVTHKAVTLDNVSAEDAFSTMGFFQPHLTNLVMREDGQVVLSNEHPEYVGSIFKGLSE